MKKSSSIAMIVVLALTAAIVIPSVAIAQTPDKSAVEAVVYLQNASGAHLGLAAVLVKTQEFGAKVAARSEAKGLPAEVKADITDHLGKYVTVQMPQPYEARLLAFEIRNCNKEVAGTLASAVSAAYLAKLREVRIETNMAAVKAIGAELEARVKEREENARKLAALKPADVPSLQGFTDTLRYRLQVANQEQMRLEAALQQADATIEMLNKRDAQSLPQVRALLENDGILNELRRQKDALTYASTPPKDAEAAAKQTADLTAKIVQRTKELIAAKSEALKAEAKEQQETAKDQLIRNQERLAGTLAASKGLESTLQQAQAINDRQSTLSQMISRLEERLTDLRIQSDSQQDMPKYLGKSSGE